MPRKTLSLSQLKAAVLLVAVSLHPGCSNQQPASGGNTLEDPFNPVAEGQTTARFRAQQILGGLFDRLDCDMDGTIDQAEIDDHFSQIWLPADTDASRALSVREYTLVSGSLSASERLIAFQAADANADGSISTHELRGHLFGLIELLDDNGDLELSLADLNLPPAP